VKNIRDTLHTVYCMFAYNFQHLFYFSILFFSWSWGTCWYTITFWEIARTKGQETGCVRRSTQI